MKVLTYAINLSWHMIIYNILVSLMHCGCTVGGSTTRHWRFNVLIRQRLKKSRKFLPPHLNFTAFISVAESDCHHSPCAVHDTSGKEILAELAGEMDYNSDCDFTSETGGNHDKQHMPVLAPSSAEKGRVAAQGTSASVFDNWESLQVSVLEFITSNQSLKSSTARPHDSSQRYS